METVHMNIHLLLNFGKSYKSYIKYDSQAIF